MSDGAKQVAMQVNFQENRIQLLVRKYLPTYCIERPCASATSGRRHYGI